MNTEILGVNIDELLSAPPAGKWCPFKELNKSDVKDMLTLLCRCVCLALAAGVRTPGLNDTLTVGGPTP